MAVPVVQLRWERWTHRLRRCERNPSLSSQSWPRRTGGARPTSQQPRNSDDDPPHVDALAHAPPWPSGQSSTFLTFPIPHRSHHASWHLASIHICRGAMPIMRAAGSSETPNWPRSIIRSDISFELIGIVRCTAEDPRAARDVMQAFGWSHLSTACGYGARIVGFGSRFDWRVSVTSRIRLGPRFFLFF